MDTFKALLPFLTFILGVMLTPYVEGRKEKSKIATLKKNILTELEDELLTLEKSIKVTNDSIQKRKYQSSRFKHISLGKRFEPLLLKKNIGDVYSSFNKDTRIALKNILLLSDQIKLKYDSVVDNWKIDNHICQANEESMIFSMLSIYWVLNKLLNEGDRFHLPDLASDEFVEMAAKALQIPTPYK